MNRNSNATLTADGHPVWLCAAVDRPEEISSALEAAPDGFFLKSDPASARADGPPSEEELLSFYRLAARAAGRKPVTVRTAAARFSAPEADRRTDTDAGAVPAERLLRQLRAVLHPGTGGCFQLLFPLIRQLEDLLRYKELLDRARQELTADGTAPPRASTGMVVEVPAAVTGLEMFTHEINFVCLDEVLLWRSLCLPENHPDRENIDPSFHPALYYQIRLLVDTAHKRRKRVSLFARAAGEPAAVPILIALGLDELIMPAEKIPAVRRIVERLTLPEARLIGAKAISYASSAGIKKYAGEALARLMRRQLPAKR